MNLAAGCIVEHTAKASQPEIAAVLSVAGSNVRIYMINGKEAAIAGKKILHGTTRPVIGVSDREQCKQALIKADATRRQIAENIDLSELYELLCEDRRDYSLDELCSFLFTEPDFDSAAALLRVLCADKVYFKSKNEMFQPASPDELKQAKELLARKEAQDAEENLLVEAVKELEKGSTFPENLKQYLTSLKDLAASTEEPSMPKRLGAVLEKSGLNNPRKIFQLLVKCGIFDKDENLLMIKYRIPTDFSEEALLEVDKIASEQQSQSDRRDLTAMKTWAIDTPGSKDRDDAFSFEKLADGGYKLYVHIADPAQLIRPCSALDKEACKRGSSVYMPDKRIHMLPPSISESLLSLDEGKPHIALTFALTFADDGTMTDYDIFESLIVIEKALYYDEANALLDTDEWLKCALDFAEMLKAKRKENGAVLFPRQPEIDIKLVDGEIVLDYTSREDLTPGMIAEFMIWANHAAAEFCRKNSIPCLFRTQEGDENPPEFGDTFDPVVFYTAIRTFRKTLTGPNPGRHYSLGLSSYTQATSPLRRYSDLVLHRQIKAFLHSAQLPYTQDDLAQTMLIADSATSKADEVMRDRERYYLYKYLKEKRVKEGEVILPGTIVDTATADAVFYVDFFCGFKRCRKPDFDVAPGQKVGVKVNQIDLFDGVIRFDIVPRETLGN